MWRLGIWLGAAALCLGFVPPPALAAGAEGPLLDARARLARMHAAAIERNYQGTMVFSAHGSLSSSRVAHYAIADQSYELIESLDGRMQRIYRHNDTVHTVWPEAGVVVVEKRVPSGPSRSLMQTVEARALDLYEMRHEGLGRVAGRDAEVLLLQPRDELRYAQRLWADLASGLMLRADVLSAARRILESSAFSQIEIGVRAQAEAVLQPLRKLGGLKVLRAQSERTQLEAEGWLLTRPLPGFQLSSCVRRPLEAVPAQSDRESPQLVQAVFSDGLTHVSLFIERFDAERHRKEVQAQIGATATLMQRRGDHWLTAMGDVPPAALQRLLDGLERKR